MSKAGPQIFDSPQPGLASPDAPGPGEDGFVDRRRSRSDSAPDGRERRQFRDAHQCKDPGALELAEAVDQYKMLHRRRFITYEELYEVMISLGYHK